jgi:RNA polymerase sigma factor (sigma-70 family)
MKMIHLKKYHTAVKYFDHSLLDACREYSASDLEFLAQAVMQDEQFRDKLVMAFRPFLKHLLMRYLGNWPTCEPYLDDMVSEGFVAITSLVNDLSPELLDGRGIIKVAGQRVCRAIEEMLNDIQSVAAPHPSTQFRRLQREEDPIYLDANTDLEDDMRQGPSGTFKNEVFDVLSQIEAKDDLDAALMSRPYWGKTEQEMAELFGVDQATIHRRKNRLYEQYQQLTR